MIDRWFRRILVLLACTLAGVVSLAGDAMADYSVNVAAMQCDPSHNRVLIRFGTVWDDQPVIGETLPKVSFDGADIPAAVLDTWSGMTKYQDAGRCILNDGENIAVSEMDGALANGGGGEDPSGYFKLIVNGHVAYENALFREGHGITGDAISAIIYQNKSLLECGPFYQSDPSDSESVRPIPECHDVSRRLLPGHKYLSGPELIELQKDNLRESLSKKLSAFCKLLPPLESFNGYSLSIPNSSYQSVVDRSIKNKMNVMKTDVDIGNDGHLSKVFFINNGFGGDIYSQYGFLIVFLDNRGDINRFLMDIHDGFYSNPQEYNKNFIKGRWGGLLIQEAMENEVFEFNGKTYIYSFDPMPDRVPSAIVSDVLSDGTLRRLCEFP